MNASNQWPSAVVKLPTIGLLVCSAFALFWTTASAMCSEMKATQYPELGIRIDMPIFWSEKVPMQRQTLAANQLILVTFGEQKEEGFPAWCALSFADTGESLPLVEARNMFLNSFLNAELISDNLVEIRRKEYGGEGLSHSLKAIGRQFVPGGSVKMVRWLFFRHFELTGRSMYMLSCNAPEKDFEVYNGEVFEPMIESVSFTQRQ